MRTAANRRRDIEPACSGNAVAVTNGNTLGSKHLLDLALFPEHWRGEEVVFVTTHCLYADGQNVTVELRQSSSDSWDVSDGGGGANVLREHLIEPKRSGTRRANLISERTSVQYKDGAWFLKHNSIDQVASAIMLVANSSQIWVDQMFSRAKGVDLERLEDLVIDKLISHFGSSHVIGHSRIVGHSSKLYEFSATVAVTNDKLYAFTAATPYGGSINSAFTKLTDVRLSLNRPLFVGVVIKSASLWAAEDLVLLQNASDGLMEIDSQFDLQMDKLKLEAA